MKKIVQGALLGGLILWFWSFVYWAISGVPLKGMRGFKDPAAVEAVMRANAPEPGFYVLPAAYVPEGPDAAAQTEARMKKIADDFFMAGAVRVGGLGGMGGQMGGSIAGNIASAGLVTWMLLQTAGLGFAGRALFVLVAGVLGWFVGAYPSMIWWGQPGAFGLVRLLDTVVGWGLAGLALSWLVGERPRG